MTLNQIIQAKKDTAFVDGYKATDAEALGLIISQHFKYDGEQIFKTLSNALEDANFHELNEKINQLWNDYKFFQMNITTIQLSELKRLNNSAMGNPNWAFISSGGAVYKTKSNIGDSYKVSYSLVGQLVDLTLDNKNRVIGIN